MSNPAKILKTAFNIGIANFSSRILGLLRVRLESAVLGGGELASGWFLAFMMPNLLRRILGEGAVATALMPLVAECQQQKGNEALRKELGVVFVALGGLLALIVLLVSLGAWGCNYLLEYMKVDLSLRFKIFLQLLPLFMPYAFFICLVGVATAILNYTRVFVLPALGALCVNIFLICGFGAAAIWQIPTLKIMPALALIVPLAGITQLGLMIYLLKKQGVLPQWDLLVWKSSDFLKRLWRLALPGIIGYSGLQLSFIIDRSLASSLGSQAVPALNYVDRLVDLPIGVFSVALGSVLMAEMSRAASLGNLSEISAQLNFSLRHTIFLGVPLAAGMIFFAQPMLRLLCLGGNYTMSDLAATKYVAIFYGIGIPSFCALKAILPAFHARKKMMTTLKVSLTGVALNIVLNLILMWPLQQGGIALATVISSLFNNLTLLFILQKEHFDCGWKSLGVTAFRSIVVALSLGAGLKLLYDYYDEIIWSNFLTEVTGLMVAGVGFIGSYWLILYLIKAPEIGEALAIIRKRKH